MSGLCSEGTSDSFALVSYVPEPLAGFVNRVRHELAPGCRLRAHITVLPPRPLTCSVAVASRGLQTALNNTRAFRVEVREIQVFSISNVVFLAIGAGFQELQELHGRLNQGPCVASEVWDYHPHVTLAQDLGSADVARARELAERRWREYAGAREFLLDRVCFVQGCPERGWADLETWDLLAPVMA